MQECGPVPRSAEGRERKARGGTEAQFTHMVLVSRRPLWTMWVGRNFTFHSLKAFLRHFYYPPKCHLFYTERIQTSGKTLDNKLFPTNTQRTVCPICYAQSCNSAFLILLTDVFDITVFSWPVPSIPWL